MAIKTETLKQVGTQPRQKPVSYTLGRILRYVILIGIGLILIMPFILTALGTFKADSEIIAFPPKFLPSQWHIENWAKVWSTDIGSGGTFPRWLFNTAFLSVVVATL